MNTKHILTSVMASAALILPASLSANSAGDRGATSTSGQHSGATGASGQYSGSSGISQGSGIQSGMTAAQIQHVRKDDLKNRVTADDLKGKDVVDRDGKKIGEVKDVGLSQVVRDGGSTYASSSANRPNASGMTSGSTQGSSSTSASTSSSAILGASSSQPNLFVELDDEAKNGNRELDYAVIPASQVTFDREEGQVRLNIARAELASNTQR